ncbi:endonuclease, partial [Escherichia coli]|nr:endonuclease [Escherichia coli]
DAYLRKFSVDLPVRFDIITLVGEKTPFTIEHIEEAFYPPIW